MESARFNNDDGVKRADKIKSKIDIKVASTSVPDIGTLDIESRLSPKPVKEEAHTNGLHPVNGICESSQRSVEANNSLSENPIGETSHLNQSGMTTVCYF